MIESNSLQRSELSDLEKMIEEVSREKQGKYPKPVLKNAFLFTQENPFAFFAPLMLSVALIIASFFVLNLPFMVNNAFFYGLYIAITVIVIFISIATILIEWAEEIWFEGSSVHRIIMWMKRVINFLTFRMPTQQRFNQEYVDEMAQYSLDTADFDHRIKEMCQNRTALVNDLNQQDPDYEYVSSPEGSCTKKFPRGKTYFGRKFNRSVFRAKEFMRTL